MNKDLPILKSKWFELYLGLFGPEISYHTNRWDNEKAVLVISLVLCKMYITLPWEDSHRNHYDDYGEYGFYFTNEPVALLRLCWGGKYKSFIMPWVRVTVDRYVLNKGFEAKKLPTLSGVDKNGTLIYPEKPKLECDTRYGKVIYSITRLDSSPNIFSKFKWFIKRKYLIECEFNKSNFTFLTDSFLCMPQQIEFQIDISNYLGSNNKY